MPFFHPYFVFLFFFMGFGVIGVNDFYGPSIAVDPHPEVGLLPTSFFILGPYW